MPHPRSPIWYVLRIYDFPHFDPLEMNVTADLVLGLTFLRVLAVFLGLSDLGSGSWHLRLQGVGFGIAKRLHVRRNL